MDNFGRPVNRIPQQPAAEAPKPTSAPSVNAPISETPVPALHNLTPSLPQDVNEPKKPQKKMKMVLWLIGLFIGLVIAAAAGAYVWYSSQLSAVDSNNTDKIRVTIASGSTPTEIAETLKKEDLIRNTDVFLWYTRIEGVQNSLQAGAYRLSPSESTQEIVEHLLKGNVDTFEITFIPGKTLKDHKDVLLSAGYSVDEIDTAFAAEYDSPLFEGKPANNDLEGFIYPDTYKFGAGASVESILQHTFDEFYKDIQENDLITKFEAQGLTLYEGIIMASIIQKEAVGGDEKQIAQVFLKRQAIGMMLGSDPTYQYITDKRGVPRDINYDSPYNTRRYEGIPPGPIASPGLTALMAVGEPAPGEYLYFLSGDDDVTYFSMTFEEHERNIVEHCQVKCQMI